MARNEMRTDHSVWSCKACRCEVRSEWAQRPNGWATISPPSPLNAYALCAACWALQTLVRPTAKKDGA